jgi:hypothetical protein
VSVAADLPLLPGPRRKQIKFLSTLRVWQPGFLSFRFSLKKLWLRVRPSSSLSASLQQDSTKVAANTSNAHRWS